MIKPWYNVAQKSAILGGIDRNFSISHYVTLVIIINKYVMCVIGSKKNMYP